MKKQQNLGGASCRLKSCCAPSPGRSGLQADEALRKQEAAAAAATASSPLGAASPGSAAPRSLQVQAGGQAYNSYAALLRQRQQALAAPGPGPPPFSARPPAAAPETGTSEPGSAQGLRFLP